MEDVPNFEALLEGDPAEGLKEIMQDLEKRLLKQGVKPHSLMGIRIAMQIAYRLGEKAGGLTLLENDNQE
jgi:anaerobic glycerol-3-phosphate dehydrogenase